MDTQGCGASHMKNSITNPSLNGPLKRSPQDMGCGHSQGGLFYCTSLACERSSGVLKGEKAVFLDQILIVSRFCIIDITNGYPFKIQPLQLNNPSFISPFADVKFSSIVETLEKSDDPMGALSIEQRSSIAHVTL